MWVVWIIVVVIVIAVVGVLLHKWRVKRIIDTLAPAPAGREGAVSFDNSLYEDGLVHEDGGQKGNDGQALCVRLVLITPRTDHCT